MKVDTNNPQAMEVMDPEARAAVIALKDGQNMKQEARKARRQAQKDQVTMMKKVAKKMHKIADEAWKKGLLDAFASVVNTGVQMSGAGKNSAVAAGANGLLQAAAAFNPHGVKQQRLQAEIKDADVGAEAARQDAANAAEDAADGGRLQESMTRLMEKVLDARHAARTAALKG